MLLLLLLVLLPLLLLLFISTHLQHHPLYPRIANTVHINEGNVMKYLWVPDELPECSQIAIDIDLQESREAV